MTTPVADKTPIPPKTWKRHSDSPSLWIFAIASSISLHLLMFWLTRSSRVFGLWFPQRNQSFVPIELIEIPITSKLPATKVSSKPKNTSSQSLSKPLPETAKTTLKNQDTSAGILNQKEVVVTPTNTKPSIKKAVSRPQPTPTVKPDTPQAPQSTPTPTPTPTVPLANLPWNRRQDIVLGKGKPLPTNGIPSEQPTNSENTIRNSSPGSTEEVSNPSLGRNSNTPTRHTPQIPTEKTSPTPFIPTDENTRNSQPSGSIVTIEPLTDQEMRQLSKDLPDVLAQYQGSSTKKLTASLSDGEIGLAPAQLLTSLVIDQNGNFQKAVILNIEPLKLQNEKGIYQQAIQELFSQERFTPAHNQDGSKPELSNLFVKIRIEPVGSN